MLKVLEGGKSRNQKSQDDEDGVGLGSALDELARQGDGALSFWAAVRQGKRSLNEIMYADSRASFERELARFVAEYQAKYPKAVEALVQDKAEISTFFDFPADHWKHLRTTNPIESTFATVKLRSRVTKGAGSRASGLTMTFKLLRAAEAT
jgi:transposase-like protein